MAPAKAIPGAEELQYMHTDKTQEISLRLQQVDTRTHAHHLRKYK